MQVEECCRALLAEILPTADPGRTGVAIDVGVGTFCFYCEMFADIGFRSIAVEPMPTDELKEICTHKNIALIQSCVSDVDGTVDLFVGTFKGSENLNLNSMRADWWGATKDKRQVKSMRLSSLLETLNVNQIACLKLDVEGVEAAIIAQLQLLPPELLPRIIMFEYGGGDTIESGEAGWSPEFVAKTLSSLAILQQLGYAQSILVDSAPDTTEFVFDLRSISLDRNSIFQNGSVYGNIISLRASLYAHRIKKVCLPYLAELPPPQTNQAPAGYFRKILRYLQRAVGA